MKKARIKIKNLSDFFKSSKNYQEKVFKQVLLEAIKEQEKTLYENK